MTTPKKRRRRNPGSLAVATNTDMTRYDLLRHERREMERKANVAQWNDDQRECSNAVSLLLRAQADGVLLGWPTWEEVAVKYPAKYPAATTK